MADTSTQQYTTKKRKNYLTYPYDYYTGTHARIFFNHVWVDDIITMQYSFKQNKSPIYGYASQKFDAVARGQIIVNGNFTIAFKETGYLSLIHKQINNLKTKKQTQEEILNYYANQSKSIEEFLDLLYLHDENNNTDFEDLAESLEDYIWKKPENDDATRKMKRPDEFDYTSDGIDLEGFDIIITFGDMSDDAAEHTVKTLNDIHIIDESMIISPDGAPIALSYSFFGRSIDEKISQAYNIADVKKADSMLGNSEIDEALDAIYANDFIIMILDAKTKGQKYSALSGENVFTFLCTQDSDPRYDILLQLAKKTNINNKSSVELFNTTSKEIVNDLLDTTNFYTFKDGRYANMDELRFDVKLLFNDSIDKMDQQTGVGEEKPTK